MTAIEALLAPVDSQNPSGPDLEYDPQFLALTQLARGKPEEQYGSKLIPAQEPNWAEVSDAAQALLARSKDLRVAMLWLRGATNVGGYDGFVDGIALMHGLLEQFWDSVHPQLDAADGNDPTMRLNALAGLVEPTQVLRDLRQAALGGQRGADALRVRAIELALAGAEPAKGETAPTEAGVRQALASLVAADAALAARLQAADHGLRAIEALIDEHTLSAASINLQPLRKLTAMVAAAIPAPSSTGASADAPGAPGGAAGPGPGGLGGSIRSREDALRALDLVCEWLTRTEPSNPAPLVIRRAQRLMTMGFMDIMRDLAPSSVEQVLKLVGSESEGSS